MYPVFINRRRQANNAYIKFGEGIMSELTKLAEIIAKHLSDAFLSMASDFAKLNNAAPLSQAKEKAELVSIIATMPTKRFNYQPRDRVLIRFQGANLPTKCRILKRISDAEYLVYPQRGLKADARKITADMIVGIDPDP